MTDAEISADVIKKLIMAMAEDMLNHSNSGTEDIYTNYVRQLIVDEGSY
jgi:hypothetical protein